MSLRVKLLLVFGITFSIILVLFGFVNYLQSNQIVTDMLEDNIKDNLDSLTTIAKSSIEAAIRTYLETISEANYIMVEYYYNEYQKGNLTEQEAKDNVEKLILAQFKKIGKDGYSWIYNYDNAPEKIICEMHPLIKGTDLAKYDFAQDTFKRKNGYNEYEWQNVGEDAPRQKAMGFKYFEPWNWSIGCGGYREEFLDLIDISIFRNDILSIKLGKRGNSYLTKIDGTMVIHDTLEGQNVINIEDANGMKLCQEIIKRAINNDPNDNIVRYYWEENGVKNWKVARFNYIEELGLVVVTAFYEDEVYKPLSNQRNILLLMIAITIVILIFIIILISNSITKPIKITANALKDIAEGEGDLTKKLKVKSKDEVGKLAEYFNRFIDNLNNTIVQIKYSITQINNGANKISTATQTLSEGTSKQAASLEEITASINEIASQVQLNVENSRKTNDIAIKTNEDAIKGNKQMKELVDAMEDINKSAQEIKNIVNVIDEIAFQTNLLALNADIEAARVGKYGKGFAVVAGSVRTLAGRSAEAVKETTSMVDRALKNVELGNELVKKTAEQLENITRASTEVTNLANEVADASQEQANGIEQISTGLGQIEEVTQANSSNAEENANASEELAYQSSKLIQIVSYFKVEENNVEKHKMLSN